VPRLAPALETVPRYPPCEPLNVLTFMQAGRVGLTIGKTPTFPVIWELVSRETFASGEFLFHVKHLGYPGLTLIFAGRAAPRASSESIYLIFDYQIESARIQSGHTRVSRSAPVAAIRAAGVSTPATREPLTAVALAQDRIPEGRHPCTDPPRRSRHHWRSSQQRAGVSRETPAEAGCAAAPKPSGENYPLHLGKSH
jgi:hypothetical protein